jgi:glutathione S-transferase
MELRYGANSPFARKVCAAAIECFLTDRITLVRTVARDPMTDLGTINPLVKVPALVMDNGEALYDSQVICEYFSTLVGGEMLIPPVGPARWRILRRQALGDGIIDAILFMRDIELPPEGEPPATAHQREKIDLSLGILENEADTMTQEGITVSAIGVGCALGWLDFVYPDYDWRTAKPALTQWYADFSRRPSMVATAPKRKD